jgi:hypothetical protein
MRYGSRNVKQRIEMLQGDDRLRRRPTVACLKTVVIGPSLYGSQIIEADP